MVEKSAALANDLQLDASAFEDAEAARGYQEKVNRLLSLKPPVFEKIEVLGAKSLGTEPIETSVLIRGNPHYTRCNCPTGNPSCSGWYRICD